MDSGTIKQLEAFINESLINFMIFKHFNFYFMLFLCSLQINAWYNHTEPEFFFLSFDSETNKLFIGYQSWHINKYLNFNK